MNTPSPLRKLGGRIRALRTAAGLAPARLAAAAMIEEETLAAIEAGRRDPDYLVLKRLAEALGVSVGALLSAMEDPDQPP
ncbi:helix-turn-helix domain-containing protein [Caulobacter segnis]|jgi:transcriptional regulator with XRE-family HTH domain|uniref:helix-turn-helix domain-containing protein n=1 Tax=Caulobacter segnis TaxID=88688 RepID=UPI001CBAF554|nr:helix-turn-helix domain-containing protein [Caulobacter segnis]UAL09746.1 helix-turn-helix domain-containing protein [Caulobacter segnis]